MQRVEHGATCATRSAEHRTEFALTDDAELVALGYDLEVCEVRRLAFDQEHPAVDDNPHDDAHWQLREDIQMRPATSWQGLRVKARAAEIALKFGDPNGELPLSAGGSFAALARSLCVDIETMAAADQISGDRGQPVQGGRTTAFAFPTTAAHARAREGAQAAS